MNDPIGDLITRIRNAQERHKQKVSSPSSKLRDFDGTPVIREISRVSKPGRRVYVAVKNLPRVNNGLGISILSTPKGVMADHSARDANVGGELLCTVF
jgi:small subunit ribosomal protein S8